MVCLRNPLLTLSVHESLVHAVWSPEGAFILASSLNFCSVLISITTKFTMSHDAELVSIANVAVSTNVVANLSEQTTLHNLREVEHVDANGNLIGMFGITLIVWLHL